MPKVRHRLIHEIKKVGIVGGLERAQRKYGDVHATPR